MYLVTGANGQLGSKLREVLADAVFVDVGELDITDKEAVDSFVKSHDFSAIINCAAYTAVDAAEDDVDAAVAVNVFGPANLAMTGVPIVHISTDYVFAGNTNRPYSEDDNTSPESVYGGTKLRGEYQVTDYAETALIIRTSWLYSEHGSNFLKTMLKLGREKDSVDVVFDQTGTPTYAGGLAEAIAEIVPKIERGTKAIYHYSNEGVCTWYDFAVEIMKTAGLPCFVNPVESESYPTRAPRPAYSVMNKDKIKRDFGLKIKHWRDGLERCMKKMS